MKNISKTLEHLNVYSFQKSSNLLLLLEQLNVYSLKNKKMPNLLLPLEQLKVYSFKDKKAKPIASFRAAIEIFIAVFSFKISGYRDFGMESRPFSDTVPH